MTIFFSSCSPVLLYLHPPLSPRPLLSFMFALVLSFALLSLRPSSYAPIFAPFHLVPPSPLDLPFLFSSAPLLIRSLCTLPPSPPIFISPIRPSPSHLHYLCSIAFSSPASYYPSPPLPVYLALCFSPPSAINCSRPAPTPSSLLRLAF